MPIILEFLQILHIFFSVLLLADMNMNIIISGESICAECGAGMETGYENIFLCTKELR